MRPGSADPKMHVHMTDNRSSSSASVLVVTVPEAAELGLYVHVPFCAKRCGYCSFNTAPLEDGAMARYLAALHREIDLLGALAWAPRVRLATVFFGGGTPSLLADDDMAAALDGIRARFDVAPDAESLWGAAGVEGIPAEQVQIDQYWRLARAAATRGLEHYEISNYARPGFRSRHNQIYWRAAEYLAAGPGACGFVGSTRYANVKATPRYCETLAAGALPIDSSEQLSARQKLGERLILGLRTADGVPASWLETRLDGDERLRRRVDTWRAQALLAGGDDRVRLTEARFLLSDALFVDLL